MIKTWCNERGDIGLDIIHIRLKSERLNSISFKANLIYIKGSLKGCILETKNYKMSLSNYNKLIGVKS